MRISSTQGDRLVNRRRALEMIGGAAALASMGPSSAFAQDAYPNRPITLVVPYSPGGGTDTLARVLALNLQTRLGQPVVVENRAGGNTVIATKYVQQQPADGYTVYLVASHFASLPATHPHLVKYDPGLDFTPITRLASILMVLVVNPGVPAKDLAGLIELSKRTPGGLSMAVTGLGSGDHIPGELLQLKTGARFNFIPYKGAAPAIQDVIGGAVHSRIDAMASSAQHIEKGLLRAIAIGDLQRSAVAPGIPTFAETIPGFEVSQFFALVGPKGLPSTVVQRLNKACAEIVKLPDVVARMRPLGLDLGTSTPEQLGAELQKEFKQVAQVVKDAGIKIE